METLTHYDRELFYAINHGLSHPLLDPVMWLFTSLGLGWVQLLLLVAVSGYLVASGGLFSRAGGATARHRGACGQRRYGAGH